MKKSSRREVIVTTKKMTVTLSLVSVHARILNMLKVTLADYTVIYTQTIGEGMEKAFKMGQNIRFIE